MKRTMTILCLSLLCYAGFAQDNPLDAAKEAAKAVENYTQKEEEPAPVPSYWKNSFQFDLGLNQTGLFNWAAGGYNTLTIRTALDAQMNYARDLTNWNNRLQMEFGFLYSSDKPWPLFQTSSDRIYLESKFSYQTSSTSKWKYTAGLDFRSQFAPSYKYNTPVGEGGSAIKDPTVDDWKNARELKSSFLSPAYTNLALGIEWVPTSWLDINISPLTGGFTIVTEGTLRNSYGMPEIQEAAGTEGKIYRPYAFQFGAQVKTDMKFVVNNVFKFETQLVLFTDYLHEPYLRVNWDNRIEWQLSRLFKIGVNTWLIYDPWIKTEKAHGVQFKESAAISFTYTFEPVHRHRRKL
ncbi:MAG: DUF3078 domain-containing protein [Bacteroidales bacterium]|nr:DUF3078 domain-containing protein [Bacteroidales bacterium]